MSANMTERMLIYQKLYLQREVLDDDGSFNPDKARLALKRHFSKLTYFDPWSAVDYSGDAQQRLFDAANDPAAPELLRLCEPQDAIDFVLEVSGCKYERTDAKQQPTTHQEWVRARFWTRHMCLGLPVAAALDGIGRLFRVLLRKNGVGSAMELLGTSAHYLTHKQELMGFVADCISDIEAEFLWQRPDPLLRNDRRISLFLRLEHESGNAAAWPLIRRYWCLFPIPDDSNSLNRIWAISALEDDGQTLGEDILTDVAKRFPKVEESVICLLFCIHFETFPAGLPFETLCRFISGPYDKLAEMALFWLPALHREDERTFGYLMTIATGDARAERRLGAFELAFFHYYNVLAAVPTLVEAARAEPDDSKSFFKVLACKSGRPSPPDSYTSARSKAISNSLMDLERRSIFAALCRRVGIDSSPWVHKDEIRPLSNFKPISEERAREIGEKALERLSAPGLWDFLKDLSFATTFRDVEKSRLEKLSPRTAEAVETWLNEAWAKALERFGFYGFAGEIAKFAVESLDKTDVSEVAERIRRHAALLDELYADAEVEFARNPKLKRRAARHGVTARALGERAFFLLRDGQESDNQSALIRATIDMFGL